MKKFLLSLFTLLPFFASAQLRCFQFGMHANHPDWRDSSCIACTADTQLITSIQAQLALPDSLRNKHIGGNIAGGNAGVNHNGPYNFSWHFIPGQWTLAELSAEVCDGRPYSDVEQDTAYWIHTVGSFCPWPSYVQKEITTTGISEPGKDGLQLAIYPNPVVQQATLVASKPFRGVLRITELTGRIVHRQNIDLSAGEPLPIILDHLAPGVYLYRLAYNNHELTGRLVKM